MSARIVRSRYGDVAFHEHWCPGCKRMHQIAVDQPFSNGARWSFDPSGLSFSPSINVMPSRPSIQCHYFITAGQIAFCSDSHHALRGQTVPLPPIPSEQWDEDFEVVAA